MNVKSLRRWMQRAGSRNSIRRPARPDWQAMEGLEPRVLMAANPIISEFVASNQNGLRDVDGDRSDWIEIYNDGDEPADMTGWSLTDQKSIPALWQFPAVTIPAGGFLVVFASDKNRTTVGQELHANFKLNAEGEYLALRRPDSSPATEFDPFPALDNDVSFGPGQFVNEIELIGTGDPVKFIVPTAGLEGSIGGSWTGNPANEPFDASTWTSGALGVGYDRQPPPSTPAAIPVTLQNATASFSQTNCCGAGGLVISKTINGVLGGTTDGWGLHNGTSAIAATAAFETVSNIGFAEGTVLEFRMHFNSHSDHNLGRFRLSITTDARTTFADGLATGGDVTANWTILGAANLISAVSAGGQPMAIQGDGSIVVTDTNVAFDQYTIRFSTTMTGITGIRLEAMQTALLPFNGPGTQNANGNAVLTEFQVTASSGAALAGETLNVAQGKTVIADGATWAGLPAENLTDGNTGSITHNLTANRQFGFLVDLGGSYSFTNLQLHNRADGCCPERLTNYTVSILEDLNGIPGGPIWTADIRTDNSNSGVAGIDTINASLDPDGLFAGRFIRIESRDNGTDRYFQIAELKANVTNYARGATVTGSGPVYPGMLLSSITDGNPDTFVHNDGIPPTVPDYAYTLNLGQSIAFQQLDILNRNDGCCPDRLTNYRVTIHPDVAGAPGAAIWSADIRTDGSNSDIGGRDIITAALDPDGSFEGQWVRIQNIDNGTNRYLQLAEVRAYGLKGYSGYAGQFQLDTQTAMKNVNASGWMRSTFVVDPEDSHDSLILRMKYDDGLVAYLNGVEIMRRNAPVGTPGWNATATASHYASGYEQISVNPALLVPGTNVLAIHGLNLSAGDDDFLIAPQLVGRSAGNLSYGYFPTPTPGDYNGPSVSGFVEDTRFSVDRGFFDAPFSMSIYSDTPGATIVYTTNGSKPTLTNGTQVPAPDSFTPPEAVLMINGTTTLRAAAFKDGFQPTNIDTQTYLFLNQVIQQPTNPAGLPASWNGFTADYQMDPDVVNNPLYSDEIIQGLKSIPTLSIVAPMDSFFGSTSGIYIYPENKGIDWEREVSLELINPDGSTGFTETAGIRVWGTGWRPHSSTAKHSFQLKFKPQYGASKLEYPLFGDIDVFKFDDLILRAQGSRGWTDFRNGPLEIESTQYIHDAWARDVAAAMGKVEGHATYVHLYINGLYWGLYNPVERPTGSFGEEYFGGDNEDYDVISHRTGEPVIANEGDMVAWNQMLALADAGLATPAAYAAIQDYVDIDNLIDYMIVNQYATNHDGPDNGSNNLRALRKRAPGEPFRFYFWDMEYTFWNVNENRNINVDVAGTATHVYTKLRENAEFRLRYADRVQKHLFNDGALTPANAAALWQARADEIYTAVIAESARWGDYRRPTDPYTRDDEWAIELNRLMTQYFPVRTGILINQLRAAGLYSTTDAPVYGQHGGYVPHGYELAMSAPLGQIYYTLDGTDPRLPSSTPVVFSTLVQESAAKKVLIPLVANGGDLLGQTWTGAAPFNDAAWTSGTGGVGYDTDPTYLPFISTNVQAAMNTVNTSAFIRIPFTMTAGQLADVQTLILKMRYDDGFIAYLNGVKVAAANDPASPAWNSLSSASHADADAVNFANFDISAFANALQEGGNILAIHGLNAALNSSDFLISAELQASPQMATDLSPSAILYTGQFPLTESGMVRSRAVSNGVWSAINDATYTVGAPTLAITEINYHPVDPTAAEMLAGVIDPEEFEFIEIANVGPDPVGLYGVRFSEGISFDFNDSPITSLNPGQRVLAVRNVAAFEARYGAGLPVAGVYTGALDNSGERITLIDAQDQVVVNFVYSDSGAWPGRADGKASTLELIDPNGDLNDGNNWRSSGEYNGSPGLAGSVLVDVIVTELLSNGGPGLSDRLELHNVSGASIDISGWWISDSSGRYDKFQIPDSTVLPANGFIVFTEADFNPTPGTPAPNHFSFNGAHGGDVWLLRGLIGQPLPLSFADHQEFGAAFEGVSFARHPEVDDAARLFPSTARTFGAANAQPKFGPVLISEIVYHPILPDNGLEYIELYNSSRLPIDLTGYLLDGAVDFEFPFGVTIGARRSLVILGFDPAEPLNADKVAAFEATYGVTIGAGYIGPFLGNLDDGGERIRLLAPDVPPISEPDFTPHPVQDEWIYDDVAPWPTGGDGDGNALHRYSSKSFGHLPSAALAYLPQPGTPRGDLGGDGVITSVDIDTLFAVFGSTSPHHDLDGGGLTGSEDVDLLVLEILCTFYGDANLDQSVSIGDLTLLAENFGNPGAWAQGDFNGDGLISIGDLTLLAENFGNSNALHGQGDDGPGPAGLQALGDGAAASAADDDDEEDPIVDILSDMAAGLRD